MSVAAPAFYFMNHPVIGELRPNRFAGPQESPFFEFSSSVGIHGLAYVEDGELHILGVAAVTEGIGQLRLFIERCKEHYGFIRIWCVLEPKMREILPRYGFIEGRDVDRFGTFQEVWDWRK